MAIQKASNTFVSTHAGGRSSAGIIFGVWWCWAIIGIIGIFSLQTDINVFDQDFSQINYCFCQTSITKIAIRLFCIFFSNFKYIKIRQ